ncbi:MAG: hydroxyacid dehydrogenase [Candidatus Moranbacteria bacterium]|nr:hydroxyacid dehydrogenase [Candidatus Moranbacteria bacterium]
MKITFFEVVENDVETIKDNFPEAQIVEEKLSLDNVEKFQDSEIICIFIYSKIDKQILDKLPNLKLVITRSAGFDHIDIKECEKRGNKFCNVPDYGSHVIAEHVFALMLSSLRNVVKGEERTNALDFDWYGLRGVSLKNKVLGIVGMGKIGSHVARIASLGFQMKVIAFDLHPNEELAKKYNFEYVSFDELLEQSDIITLHCPLNCHTEHMINRETIAKMKDGVSIINTSRGGILNTEDVLDAVKSGRISHLALDVLEDEQNIEENKEIMTYPNIIITPHIAFYSDDSVKKMYSESFRMINEFLEENK